MNKYIHKLIYEQFNIGNMNLNNNIKKCNMNIFNKEWNNHPYYQKILNGTVTEDEIKELDSLINVAIPNDKEELQEIIKFYSENYSSYSLNWLCVYRITDMCYLFQFTEYNGDISKWDTSNVTDMRDMFNGAKKFNQPIGEWDVSNVTDMSHMFSCAQNFNQSIGGWDVSHVTNMKFMFNGAYEFNQPIGDWDVSSVTNMSYMFSYTDNFNQLINDWDVSGVTNMDGMFKYAREFNQPIGGWDVSNVTDMRSMFYGALLFNQDISMWNIGDKVNKGYIFLDCPISEKYKPVKLRYKL